MQRHLLSYRSAEFKRLSLLSTVPRPHRPGHDVTLQSEPAHALAFASQQVAFPRHPANRGRLHGPAGLPGQVFQQGGAF